MTAEQFEREKHYQAVMSVARRMLAEGIYTPDEYRVIDTMVREKYRPLFSGLYPLKPLLYKESRGNMLHWKEG